MLDKEEKSGRVKYNREVHGNTQVGREEQKVKYRKIRTVSGEGKVGCVHGAGRESYRVYVYERQESDRERGCSL